MVRLVEAIPMNMMLAPTLATATPIKELQDDFLTMLPQITAVVRFGFRHLRDQAQREERIAEAVARCWKWFRRLDDLGERHRAFPTALAGFAVKQVKCGRSVVGQPRSADAMNPAAQNRHGFRIEPLLEADRRRFVRACHEPTGQRYLDAWEEMLTDNTQTPVDQQAQFRIDWPHWLSTRSDRDRRLIRDMSVGERTLDLAEKYWLSPARISQKRREYHADWHRFSEGRVRSGHNA
jgi:hypothetical protein